MNNFKLGKLKFKEGLSKPTYIPKKARKQEEVEEKEEQEVFQPD